MKIILRMFAALAVIYSTLLMTACPAASLQKVSDSSARIATYANAGVNLTRSLYEAKVITIGQKDDVATKFVQLAQAGVAFDAAVAKAKTVYGTTAPASEIQRIFATFDSEVVGKFLDVLASLKLIAAKGKYAAIIETIRAAFMVVAGVFGHSKSVGLRLEAAL